MSILGPLLISISSNTEHILVFVVIFLLTLWISQPRRPWILPNGPFAWPIIGNLIRMMPIEGDNSGAKRLLAISKKYGSNIISFKIGSKQAIVLNKFVDLKEAYCKDEFAFGNPEGPFRILFPGIAGSDGAQSKEQRRFAVSTLRDFGLGKNRSQEIIQEELQRVIEKMTESRGRPFNPRSLICCMVSNIMCSLIFGRRFDYDDKTFKRVLFCADEIVNEALRYMTLGYLLPPWIRDNLPGDIFRIKYGKSLHAELRDFLLRIYREHVAMHNDGESRDYMDAFIKEMKDRKLIDNKHWFTESFNPLRFIGKYGKVIKHDHMIPFSIGKRKCPGESLARMEVFLIFAGIMQKFRIEIPPGGEAALKIEFGNGLDAPVESDLCFIRD
ncbi:unnamed protein product [Owenia fusiformis]|uniref:Uncharacterized protein n=1 Tax=Owenia fusiformis TaxID=6347 RepID=A0A8J1UF89_OWEFU|nr:unnamed protein product [Owenia fusiformis]